jgi:hypothetical protein
MALYAQDAMTTDKPWELWEVRHTNSQCWDVLVKHPIWDLYSDYRRKPLKSDLEKYGAKEGDIWIIKGDRLLFTGVVQGRGIDCMSLADAEMGAFEWDWDEFKEGVLIFRAGKVNKL